VATGSAASLRVRSTLSATGTTKATVDSASRAHLALAASLDGPHHLQILVPVVGLPQVVMQRAQI